MARQLPIIFGQRDYLQQLGTTGGTIKDWGCKLTTFATLAKACGKDTDPIELNSLFIQKEIYSDGKNLADDAITKVFPDILFLKAIDYTNSPADLNLIKEELKDPTVWAILRTKIPAPFNTHFVLVTGINGVVAIADPLTKKTDDFAQRYGDPATQITKVAFYKGNPLLAEQVDEGVRHERDVNWNVATEVISHLGVPITSEDKAGMVQRAKQKVDSYISEISGLKLQIEDYKKKYEEELQENKEINATLETYAGTRKEYGQETLDAQHKVTELEKDMNKIADELQLQYSPTEDKKLVDEILEEIRLYNQKIRDAESPESQLARGIISLMDKHLALNNYLEKLNMEPINVDDLTDSEIKEKLDIFIQKVRMELLKDPKENTTEVMVEKAVSTIQDTIKKKGFLERILRRLGIIE